MQTQEFTSTGRQVVLLPIMLVRPHEQHDPEHAASLRSKIVTDGTFTHPICLDRQSLTLLDGHHRFRAAQSLGFAYIPSVLVDYWSDDISVTAWREGETVTRENVLAAAASGQLLPIKTSRHRLRRPIGECATPLAKLARTFARAPSIETARVAA